MIDRERVEKVIGKEFADRLDEQVFNVDGWYYTRREMVEELGCANFIAAARLQKVLKKLNVNSAASLHKTDPFSLARTRGIGEASLFVAMCILDANNFDVLKWWRWKDNNSIKFTSFKQSAMYRAKKHKHEI